MNSAVKIIHRGEGESVWAMTEKFTFKLGPEDTNGVFSLSEMAGQPGGGPPPHIHHREDELFYILEGEFAFTLGEKTFTRSAGYATCLPKGVLHTYNNVGDRPGKLLVIAIPCGFEKFIRRWARPVERLSEQPPQPTQKDINRLLAAAPEFGIEIHPEATATQDSSRPATDETYWVMGQRVDLKLTAADSSGQFSVAEVRCCPGECVPNHLHVAMDELFYVLEGTAEFTLADRVERVEAGGIVFVPRRAIHGFRNTGKLPFRMFDLHTPGGFEEFFREAGVPAINRTSPPAAARLTEPQTAALMRKHGMELHTSGIASASKVADLEVVG